MLAITVVVGELVYSRHQNKGITDAVATALHFVLDGVQSFVFGLVWTVITKFVAGGLRPDFLDRCQPANTALGMGQVSSRIHGTRLAQGSEVEMELAATGRCAGGSLLLSPVLPPSPHTSRLKQ